jgi:tripartite-type tricarboxylate transporter receptor subunit TctC
VRNSHETQSKRPDRQPGYVAPCRRIFVARRRRRLGPAFYKGRTIYIVVGDPPGGSYDFYARLAADMLKAHMPGVGSVVVEDKPGRGGFTAAAYLYNEAPKDATYLGVLPETMAQAQVLDPSSARWKMQNFNMIGSFAPANSVFMLRKNAPVTTVEEMKTKQINVGCTGNKAQSYQYSSMLKTLGSFKFKLVRGYRGSGEYGPKNVGCCWSQLPAASSRRTSRRSSLRRPTSPRKPRRR